MWGYVMGDTELSKRLFLFERVLNSSCAHGISFDLWIGVALMFPLDRKLSGSAMINFNYCQFNN